MKTVLMIALSVAGFFLFSQHAHATVYYIDLNNGSDGAAGTATTTAFSSIGRFANNARAAGDCAYVRRGTASTTVYTDITFTTDGTLQNPICLSADYDNLWGDFANSAETYTVTFGSTTILSSASSTDIQVGDWIYVVGDHSETPGSPSIYGKSLAYEVATTTATYLELYLPYKGPTTGSGKTLRIMPHAPVWNNTAGDFQMVLNTDNNWILKGLDIAGTDALCNVHVINSRNITLEDIILKVNGTTSCGIGVPQADTITRRVRFIGGAGFINFNSTAATGHGIELSDAYVDCVSGSVYAITAPNIGIRSIYNNLTVVNCLGVFSLTTGSIGAGARVFVSNLVSNNPPIISSLFGQDTYLDYFFTDYKGVVRDSFTTSHRASSTAPTTTQVSYSMVRSGGGNSSMLVKPPGTNVAVSNNTGISTKNFPNSFIKLFEYPIYAASNTPYTYTMYFNQASTTGISDWTADPTASEMWIEAEYYNDPVDADRYLNKSTGTVDFNGTATSSWKSLAVSATTTQDGILYLRGWYGKPKETAKENSFYMDVKPVISSP